MLELVLGIAGFALYVLYDINSYTIQCRLLQYGFWAGSFLIGMATILQLYSAWMQGAFSGLIDGALMIIGVLAFGFLIYCLFFALPFQETYVDPVNGRQVYDRGAYALCRHPGVICFFAMYLFIGLAAFPAPLLVNGMIFSLLNVTYAWFQDQVTFPKSFFNYAEYRERVPFLIPTKDSIRRAGQTWRRSDGKEGKL